MSGKILLVCFGSLGDFQPFLTVAQELRGLGLDPVLATLADHVPRAHAAGLEAHAVYPDMKTIYANEGYSVAEGLRRFERDSGTLIGMILQANADSIPALERLATGASAIVGNTLALSAECVAEKTGLPFVPVYVQPYTFLSPYDPPRHPQMPTLIPNPGSVLAIGANKVAIGIAELVIRVRFQRRFNKIRASAGLGRYRGIPAMRFSPDNPLSLALFSPLFGPLPPDAPAHVVLTGFPFENPEKTTPLDDRLEAFFQAGAPPIVFTLGSFAVKAAGGFFGKASEISHALGRRAILIGAGSDLLNDVPDLFCCEFAPYARLFPRAALVVHQAGIGTIAEGLRAGVPQMLVPHSGDHWDNAARTCRLGIAKSLTARRFSARRAIPLIRDLLEDGVRDRARDLSRQVENERGGARAAEAIAGLLGRDIQS